MSLKQQAIKGGASMLFGQIVKLGLNLASISVLARFLSPEDYGLVAIAISATVVLETIRDAGLSTATLQRPEISQLELSSMHWVNVGLGLVVFVIVLLLTPVLKSVYDKPELLLIIPCYGFFGLVGSFGVQRVALMQRRMEFKKLVLADVASQAFGLGIGIVAAINGLHYWSLILAQFTTALSYNIGLVLASGWRPDFAYDHARAKPLLAFGYSIMASRVLVRLARGADALLIGYALGAQSTGIYNRSQSILNRPMDLLASPLLKIALAVMCRTAEDSARFRNVVLGFVGLFSLGGALAVVLFASLAEPIVLIFLGKNWEQCIPIFVALIPSAFVEPFAIFLTDVMVARGRASSVLSWTRLSVLTIVAGLIIGLNWGLLGVALSFIVTGLFIRLPMLLFYTSKESGIPFRSFCGYVLPQLVAGAVAAAYPFWLHLSGAHLTIFASVGMTAGALSLFTIVWLLFPRGRQIAAIVRSLVPSQHRSSLADALAGNDPDGTGLDK